MAVCIVCTQWGESALCGQCRSKLTAVSSLDERGFVVQSAFRHEGPARRLIHLLKYHAVAAAADVLASAMVARLPAGTNALVPVPRAWMRRVRHGVDPAVELSRRLARATGIPMVFALRPQLWWPSHAGSDRASRRSPRFRQVAAVPSRAVLIDDVVTTGITLMAAGDLVSIRRAVTATRALGSSFDRMTVGQQQQRSSFAKSTHQPFPTSDATRLGSTL